MLDVSAAMLANQAMNYLVSGKVAGARAATGIRTSSRRTCSPVADGHIVVAVGNDEQFVQASPRRIERGPNSAQDERFPHQPRAGRQPRRADAR